jgi:hypothetical protein
MACDNETPVCGWKLKSLWFAATAVQMRLLLLQISEAGSRISLLPGFKTERGLQHA